MSTPLIHVTARLSLSVQFYSVSISEYILIPRTPLVQEVKWEQGKDPVLEESCSWGGSPMNTDAATDMRSNDDGDEVGGTRIQSCLGQELACC